MANKQIKDFEVITDGTGTSILVQNNTTDAYNKISAENIAAAATVLSKAITAQENVTILKQIQIDVNNTSLGSGPVISKQSGKNLDNTTAGIIELDFTSDTNKDEAWGLKINNGSENYGVKADGKTFAHHVIVKFDDSVNCSSPAVRYMPSENNWNNTDTGVFEADLTTDLNYTGTVWGLKIKEDSNTWGIKVDGDAVLKNAEANSLNSNHLNLVDQNLSTLNSSSIELGNHGGSYTPASIEIKNSDGSGTSLTIPTDILTRKYLSMAAASAAGVPVGGVYLQVDSLTNTTSAVWATVV